jgi:hypothetical protein
MRRVERTVDATAAETAQEERRQGASRAWRFGTGQCRLLSHEKEEGLLRKQIALATLVLAFSGHPAPAGQMPAIQQEQASGQESLPKVSREFLGGTGKIHLDAEKRALLSEIRGWLCANFELPCVSELPHVTLAKPSVIEALRYNGLRSAGGATQAEGSPPAAATGTTVAIYLARERTIYLPEQWTGATPADLSVLVHEMVHHLQDAGRLKYDCLRAGERLAYAAQDKWLAMFGRNLVSEFEVDPFTILANSTCHY